MPSGIPPSHDTLKTCSGDHASHPRPGPGPGRGGKNVAAVLIARDDPPGTCAGFREDPYSPFALAMILAGLPVILV
jgi:hypothetical protein